MQTYVVKCLKCKGERRIQVHLTAMGKRIDWIEDKAPNPATIVSGRERLDGQFGFQCMCGNNDLLTRQESATFANPAAPQPQELKHIVENLKVDKPKFQMVEA